MSNYIVSKSKVKKFALEYAATNKAHPFTRVSQEFIDAVEANARTFIRNTVQSNPSKGKTIHYA